MSAVLVKGISKRFGRVRALHDIRFAIEPGEMVALIGASGSGKSTLIRIMAGLERSDAAAGRVDILGRSMQAGGRVTRDARSIRRDVGVIFQQFNLIGRLSVLTNVLTGCLGRVAAWRGTLGLFPREERLRAMAALKRVGIAQAARQRASTLSGGQQQRAAIARALVQNAKLLLADEPIASLDPASAKRVMDTIAAVNRDDGIAVIVSLHQVEYAWRYCPRTVALRGGEVAYDGPSAALTPELLRDIYGDSSEELLLPEAPAGRTPPRLSKGFAGVPGYAPA